MKRSLLDLSPLFFPADLAPAVEAFYRLRKAPFEAAPDSTFLFESATGDRAAFAVRGAIDRRDRLVVVTGARGVGKTLLCRRLFGRMGAHTLTSFVANPSLPLDRLLQTVLLHLGAISDDQLASGQLQQASQRDLLDLLDAFLRSLAARQALAVVIVDDAEKLPLEVLHELEELGDRIGSPVLQLMLVGASQLLETLDRPERRSLNRPAGVRVKLGTLASDEVARYIRHRLALAGGSHVDVDDEALTRVSALSGGVPAVVNALCSRALEEGQRLARPSIDRAAIDAAAEAIGVDAPPALLARLCRRLPLWPLSTMSRGMVKGPTPQASVRSRDSL